MKQLSTKSIGSLLAATAAATRDVGRRATDKHLERLLKRHDRKGELRASILGMSAPEFRDELRRHSFEEMIRLRGFKGKTEFMTALRGRLRDELYHRGWSRQRINEYIDQKMLVAA